MDELKKKSGVTAADEEMYFNINHVAKMLDVVPATIRNWEKAGLFTAKRRGNNYRVFSVEDIELLKKIKQYSIDESMNIALIKKVLANDVNTAMPVKRNYPKKIYYKKLREYREARKYTLEDVSGMVGISSSYLSKVENGQSNISINLLSRLAEFYGESLITFLGAENEEQNCVVYDGEGTPMDTLLNGVEIKSLTHYTAFQPVTFTVAPGCGDFKSHRHSSGQEFIYVLSGKLQVTLDEKNVYLLKDNDSISFASTRMHNWHNSGKSTLKLLWIHSSL